MWGMLVAVFQLNLVAMAIAITVNLTLSEGPFSLWPYLFYLFTLTLPTIVFVTGLTFLVKGLCQNQAVSLLVLLPLFYAIATHGKTILHGALDVYATGVPNIFSDVTGFSGLNAYLAQRACILLLGAGWCILAVRCMKRLPNEGRQAHKPYAAAIALLAIGTGIAGGYHGHFSRAERERAATQETFRQYNDAVKAHAVEHHIHFRQEGESYKACSRLTLQNDNEEAMDSVVLYLNPGLQVTGATSEGRGIGVKRRNQVAVLDMGIPAGGFRELELRYEGNISPSVMYTEVENLREKEAERKFFVFQPGNELFYLTAEYTLLVPECLWYPTTCPPTNADMPYFSAEDFTRFTLEVVETGGRTVVSQGSQSTLGDTTRFRNARNLPGISLCIGDYTRYAIKTDTLDMKERFPDLPYLHVEDTILCEVYILKGHEYLLEKLQDARPYIGLWGSNFLIDPRAYAKYIFDKLALVEVPIHFVSYNREWKTSTDHVQPELVLRPEREAFTNALTCRANLLHDIRGGAVEVTEDLLRAENYLQAFFPERPLYRWDLTAFKNQFMDNERCPNEYCIDLLYKYQFYHVNSAEFPGIHNLFTAMMENWDVAVGHRASDMSLINPEDINYYSTRRNLFDLLRDKTQPSSMKTDMIHSQSIALLREIATTISPKELERFTHDYLNRHNFANIHYEDYCEEVHRRFGTDLLTLTRKYYERNELPRFIIRNARFIAEGKKGERTGYGFSVDIWNTGGSDGTVTILPPDTRKIWSFSIPAKSQRRINLYISGNPEDIEYDLEEEDFELQTNLAENCPGDFHYALAENEYGEIDRHTGLFEIDSTPFLPKAGEYITDNEDAGFHIDDKKSKMQRLLQDKAVKKKSSSPGWVLTYSEYAHGEYMRSFYRHDKREDEQTIPRITWETNLPTSGKYEVLVRADKACAPWLFKTRKREDEWRIVPLTNVTQTYLVSCRDGEVEVEIPLGDEGGWISLGEFVIDAGKAQVVLTDKLGNPEQGLIADAVKWIKQND